MVCIGHSFMVCVLNAAKEEGLEFRAILLKGLNRKEHLFGLDRTDVVFDDAKPELGAEATSIIQDADRPVVSFIGGINHVQLGLRGLTDPAESPPFDFVLPAEPELPLDADAQIVPYDVVREQLQQSFKRRVKLLRKVAQLAREPLIQVESPPPVNDDWLEAWLRRNPIAGVDDPRLPSRFVRYKLWRVTSEIFREAADAVGGTFVECPPEALDDDGFMREEYVRNMTHGNEAFGRLLLDRLRAAV